MNDWNGPEGTGAAALPRGLEPACRSSRMGGALVSALTLISRLIIACDGFAVLTRNREECGPSPAENGRAKPPFPSARRKSGTSAASLVRLVWLTGLLAGQACHAQTEPGASLRAQILHEYAELKRQHALSPDPERNDISALVEKTIRPGMPFEDAREILRQAGMKPSMAPRPADGIPEDDNSRFQIFAGMLLEQEFLGQVNVYLVIYPKTEQDQNMVVGRVHCTIKSSSL